MVARQVKTKKRKEDVDYAAAADRFAESASEDDETADDTESEDENEAEGDQEAEENEEDSDDSDDSDGEELDDGVEAVFTGIKIQQTTDEGSEEVEEQDVAAGPSIKPKSKVSGDKEVCSFDLRNLVAVNSHPVHIQSLYKKDSSSSSNKRSSSTDGPKLTIPATGTPTTASSSLNEDYLLQKATEGCTQLIQALWELPVERSDAGPLVQLPTYDILKIPRGLPPPQAKEETRWEKFARERGIGINKEKRSRKVWDEATGTWMYRTGYQKANAKDKEWPIMEVGANDDPFEDPWEKLRDEKNARTQKNKWNQLKNQERAGIVEKGTARRLQKNREQIRQKGREGGKLDHPALPTGIPVDLKSSTQGSQTQLRGKVSTMAALKSSQISTASLGKFDKRIEGEPERRLPTATSKKRKSMEEPTSKKLLANETERGMKLLKTVLDKGGLQKEKDRKKGKLATGVTAYDYEFDDGLGPGSFRKKKGRAGSGKNKKMTKKRLKG